MNIITRIHIAWADGRMRRRQRKLYDRMKQVGQNVYLCRDWYFSAAHKVEMGSHIWIGEQFYARAEGGLTIGSGTIISRCVEIWTVNHNYDSPDLQAIPYDRRMVERPVSIGENVWIGTHALILPGAVIGEGAVIGAGAVVRGHVPPLAIVTGNPGQITGYRSEETYRKLKEEGKVYLDMEYDFDRSSLRKTQWWGR